MPQPNKPKPHTDHTLMAFLRHRVNALPTTRTIRDGKVATMIDKDDVMSWIDDCLNCTKQRNQ